MNIIRPLSLALIAILVAALIGCGGTEGFSSSTDIHAIAAHPEYEPTLKNQGMATKKVEEVQSAFGENDKAMETQRLYCYQVQGDPCTRNMECGIDGICSSFSGQPEYCVCL